MGEPVTVSRLTRKKRRDVSRCRQSHKEHHEQRIMSMPPPEMQVLVCVMHQVFLAIMIIEDC